MWILQILKGSDFTATYNAHGKGREAFDSFDKTSIKSTPTSEDGTPTVNKTTDKFHLCSQCKSPKLM